MRHPLQLLVPVALLACLACQPQPATPVYGPWEEGLTLTFEDPSRPQPQRSADRLQVRVTRATLSPGAPTLVELEMANTHGHLGLQVRHQTGGSDLVDDQGRVLAQLLPPGFPATAHWVERGTECSVIGRAAWEGAALLPATSDPIGIWVETRSPQGLRRRTLFLPNLGEVESREERDGAWVTVNRLVGRGFTDLPTPKRPVS
jgi:hypothetical protein